jgi:O-antigen ligase
MANGTSTLAFDRTHVLPLVLVGIAALAASSVAPETFSFAIFGFMAMVLIITQPAWGIGILLAMLMMQYRNQFFWISQLLPSGEGLLSINNVIGIFLALVMAYRIYRDGDWSFARSRQLQFMVLIIAALILSSLIHPIDYASLTDLGLRPPNQDPVRLMVSRALFVVLAIFFLYLPKEIRLLAFVFLALSLISAGSASIGALSGAGWEGGVGARVQETYRAGGSAVVARAVGNPNRLAMIATLTLVLVWEWGQSARGRRFMLVGGAVILGLILTVFLTASRGGMLGLLFTGFLLFASRRREARGLIYAGIVVIVTVGLVSELVPEQALERLTNIPGLNADADEEGAGSMMRRGYTLGIAYELSQRDPIFGIGVGNWEKERFLIDPVHAITVPHNSYMLTLVESGLIGLILYLMMFWITIRSLNELEKDPELMERAGREGLDWLIRGAKLCLISFLVFSMFADLWETVNLYLLIGISGALLRRYQIPRPHALAA